MPLLFLERKGTRKRGINCTNKLKKSLDRNEKVVYLRYENLSTMGKQNKEHNYSEADLILMFGLERIKTPYTALMTEWTSAETLLTENEEVILQKLWMRAVENIEGWQEEDLKMKFLSPVLELSNIMEDKQFKTYFEKMVSAEVEGHFLKTKTDFMVAKGILDKPQAPYFHFQEWKPHKRPTGDSMAQLLEALLIAQTVNECQFPMYGGEVMGKQWSFVILEGKSYCVSNAYDVTKVDDLRKVVAMLRKFTEILKSRMLK